MNKRFNQRIEEQSIEIDCAPMTPRPDTWIGGIVAGTGLPEDGLPGRITNKFFGNWVWDFSDVPQDVWDAANSTIKERLTNLFEHGRARYVSW